jgi:hypothetical protein
MKTRLGVATSQKSEKYIIFWGKNRETDGDGLCEMFWGIVGNIKDMHVILYVSLYVGTANDVLKIHYDENQLH